MDENQNVSSHARVPQHLPLQISHWKNLAMSVGGLQGTLEYGKGTEMISSHASRARGSQTEQELLRQTRPGLHLVMPCEG